MAHVRIRARFYVLLLLFFAAIGYFIFRNSFGGVKLAVVQPGSIGAERTEKCVILRDEEVIYSEGFGHITFIANEGSMVRKGDPVADIYTAGYDAKTETSLETVRQDIRVYYRDSVLGNIKDTAFIYLENEVLSRALDLRQVILNPGQGSVKNLAGMLEQSMSSRQNYLVSQYSSGDTAMSNLFNNERLLENRIDSWKTQSVASKNGIVSFYLDNVISGMSVENIDDIMPEDIKTIISGGVLASNSQQASGKTPVYRIVEADHFYVLVLSNDKSWYPQPGEPCTIDFDGYESASYQANVINSTRVGGEMAVKIKVIGSVLPFLSVNSTDITLGLSGEGLAVPIKSIRMQDELAGVAVLSGDRYVFVPVQVIASSGSTALVKPLQDGALTAGMQVYLGR